MLDFMNFNLIFSLFYDYNFCILLYINYKLFYSLNKINININININIINNENDINSDSDSDSNENEEKNKIINEQNNLNIFQEEAHKYKDEKINEEGFCENAKLNIEISDIEIKKCLTDVNTIFLYLIYNNQKAEFNFTYSKNIKQFTDKIFEFKSVSKKDHFELILKYTKNNSDYLYDLSKKVFPLEEITTQDEYGVQITLPEEKNQDQVVAFINAKITLHWSDYKFYLDKVKNSEIRIRKLNEALFKVNQYLSQINELYKNNTSNIILRNKANNITTENTQSNLGQINQMDSAFSSDKLKGPNDNIKNKSTKNDDDLMLKMNEDIENDLKEFEDLNEEKNYNKNSYKNLNAISLVKLLSLLCVLFSLFNSSSMFSSFFLFFLGFFFFWVFCSCSSTSSLT